MMNSPVEYLFDGRLRWAFGFENPNKAAVVFVCLLPLLWILWDWGWRRQRAGAWVCAGLMMLGTAVGLCLTYSRGGLVAAAAAIGYIIFRERKTMARMPRTRWIAEAALLVAVIAVVLCTGLASRSAEPLAGGDASVGNRLVVWLHALEMAAERPLGFGAGGSGEAYMQWYQPLDANAGYRTMVSGYLTPLVEFGWPAFAAVVVLIAVWWRWADPSGAGWGGGDAPSAAIGLRASLVGFAVAAIFSTITEEWMLWVLPGAAVVALSAWTLKAGCRTTPGRIAAGAGACAALLLALYLAGVWLSAADPLARGFWPDGSVSIEPKERSEKRVGVIVDAEVLGATYGRMLREMALSAGVSIEVSTSGRFREPVAKAILCGNAVAFARQLEANIPLDLVCPVAISGEQAAEILGSRATIRLWLPEIADDGRTAFWRAAAEKAEVPANPIPGVGTRIDWAWSGLIAKLIAGTKASEGPGSESASVAEREGTSGWNLEIRIMPECLPGTGLFRSGCRSLMHDLANVCVGNEVNKTIVILNDECRLGRQCVVRRRNRPGKVFGYFDGERLKRNGMQQSLNLFSHSRSTWTLSPGMMRRKLVAGHGVGFWLGQI